MADGLKPIPDIPIDLLGSENLVIFIGAGVSMRCGYPSWWQFSLNVINQLIEKEVINYSTKKQLESLGDPKKILSICENFARNAKKEIAYEETLKRDPDFNSSIYESLLELPTPFITTNYDSELHTNKTPRLSENNIKEESTEPSLKSIYDDRETFPEIKLDSNTVVHLHGRMNDRKSMIITANDYLEHYNKKNVIDFLKKIFREKSVLFIGYGLEETEIIEHMLRKADINDIRQNSRYALMPFFSHEKETMDMLVSYYKESFNVEIIPYSLDQKDFSQLDDIVVDWVNSITKGLTNLMMEIDRHLEEANPNFTESDKKILVGIKDKKKLLPFFFQKLSSIKWLDQLICDGWFNVEDAPSIEELKNGSYRYPRWPVLNYLLSIASQLQHDTNTAQKVLDIIRDVSQKYKNENTANFQTWLVFSDLMNLMPLELISTPEDVIMIEYWLECKDGRSNIGPSLAEGLLMRCLNDGDYDDLSIEILKSLLTLRFETDKWGSEQAYFPFDTYFVDEFFTKNCDFISSTLKFDFLNIVHNCLNLYLSKSDDDSLSFDRPAIEENQQNDHHNEVLKVLVQLYRDSVDQIAQDHDVKDHVKKLFSSKYRFHHRLAIYFCNTHFNSLKSLRASVIKKVHFSTTCKHELYHFLQKHFDSLTPTQEDKVLDIIDSIRVNNPSIQDSDIQAYIAAKKQDWLDAIKNSENEKALSLLREVKTITQVEELEFPDFSSYTHGFRAINADSPLTVEKIQSMKVDDLVTYFRTFEGGDSWKNEPCIEGLAEEFKNAVIDNPRRYLSELNKFIGIPYDYIDKLIFGLNEYWSTKKNNRLNWQSILAYFEILFTKVDFSQNELNQANLRRTRSNWILKNMAKLIESGCKTDTHSFEEAYYKQALNIIIKCLNTTQVEEYNLEKDPIHIAINSAKGSAIEALINLCLWRCRYLNKETSNHLEASKVFIPIFEEEFQKETNYDILSLAPSYISNFMYIDKDWTLTNLNLFFPEDDLGFYCSMSAYLRNTTVHQEVFQYLQNRDHWKRAIQDDNFSKKTDRRIADFIVFAYMNDYEESNVVLDFIIRSNDENLIERMFTAFSSIFGNNITENGRQKVIQLWNELINNDFFSKEFLENSLHWLCFINNPQEQKELILASIKQLDNKRSSHYLLFEFLNDNTQSYPDACSEILLVSLEKQTPYLTGKDFDVLRKIYHSGSNGQDTIKVVSEIYLKSQNKQVFDLLQDLEGENIDEEDSSEGESDD